MSCDDCCAVWLNGQALGEHADWRTGREFEELQNLLLTGRNTLAIEGENRPAPVTRNPAGLLCRLEIRFAGGATMRVDTDDEWRASKTVTDGWQGIDFDARDWPAPKLLGAYGCAPWGEMAADTSLMSPLCAAAGDRVAPGLSARTAGGRAQRSSGGDALPAPMVQPGHRNPPAPIPIDR